jgi:hypothetical protein
MINLQKLIEHYQKVSATAKDNYERASKLASEYAEKYGQRNRLVKSYRETAQANYLIHMHYEGIIEDLKAL